MIFTKCYPIVIQNGDKVVHEISVSENKGVTTYAVRKNGKFHAISEEKFNTIMDNARSKKYYIFNYGIFD